MSRFNPDDFNQSSQQQLHQPSSVNQPIQYSSYHNNRQPIQHSSSQNIQRSSHHNNRQQPIQHSLSQPIEPPSSCRSSDHIQPSRHSNKRHHNIFQYRYRQNHFFYASYKEFGRQLRSHPRADSTMQRWAGYCDNICNKVVGLDNKNILLMQTNLWLYLKNVVGYNTWHHQHIGKNYYIYIVNENGIKSMWIENSIKLLIDIVVRRATGQYDNNERRHLDAHAIAERLSINRGRDRGRGSMRGGRGSMRGGRGSMRGRRRDAGRNRNNRTRTNKISLAKLLAYNREEFETVRSGQYLIMMAAITYEFDRLSDKDGYGLADFSDDAGINTIGQIRFDDWTKKLSLKDGWKAQVKGTGRGLRTFEHEELKDHVTGLLNIADKTWAYKYIMGTHLGIDEENTSDDEENNIDDDDDEENNIDDDDEEENNGGDAQVSSYAAVRGGHPLDNVRFDPIHRPSV